MKPAPPSTALDAFIRDAIKSPGNDLPLVDWSEVEVLLRHEQKSFSIGIGKKTILLSAAVAVGLIIVFCMFMIVQHYSSLPPDPTAIAPSENTFIVTDTQKTVVTHDSVATIDSSAFIAAAKKKADSIAALTAVIPADTTATKKINEKQPAVKDIQKQDKKQKENSTPNPFVTDSSAVKKNNVPVLSVDTASAPPSQEIKISEERPAADTAGKNNNLPKKNSKGKKSKQQKIAPPEMQPDTLNPK